MFPLAQELINRALLVPDETIQAMQRALWQVTRIASEPGGAAAFAALLGKNYVPNPNERVCVIVCSGNTADVRL
jgi:threonine dehydratase